LEIQGAEASHSGVTETWLALSNGRIGVRGSYEQGPPRHQPGTLVNGFHETWPIRYPEGGHGYATSGQTIIYVPDATSIEATGWQLADATVTRRLDLRRGLLTTIARWPDRTMTWERLVSLVRPGVVAIRFSTPDPPVQLVSGWRNRQDLDYREKAEEHFDPRRARSFDHRVLDFAGHEVGVDEASLAAVFRAHSSGMSLGVAIGHRVPAAGSNLSDLDQPNFEFEVRQLEKVAVYLPTDEASVVLEASALVHGTGVPAKGLTGQTYEGHYFWDTDVFVLPFLANVHPAAARELIAFRHSLLPKARERARVMNENGALFPWRTINGEEASAYYEAGTAQYHINGAVIYGVDSYLKATADLEVLWDWGVELAVETARMWAGLGFFDDTGFHLHMVTGPDEYTALVDDNAYTNLVARFNLRCAVDWLKRMRKEVPDRHISLRAELGIAPEEVAQWEEAAARMFIPYDPERGLTPQDVRFLEREQWDWSTPEDLYPLLLHFHPLVIYRHQVLKQADVVMAMYLFPDQFDPQLARANFDYYDPLTTGDSSLSPAIQAAVAARLGLLDEAVGYLRSAAFLDLSDSAGNTADGVHLATAGGVWHAIVGGFGGLSWSGGEARLDPHLPPNWTELRFAILVHGVRVEVESEPDRLRLRTTDGRAVEMTVGGRSHRVDSTGIELELPLR
jgi:trehalose/maltose hydrolase-like predicted phosphorylase